VRVRVAENGTLAVQLGSRTFAGLAAVEDVGDRGDSYDCDPVGVDAAVLRAVRVRRRRHPSGLASLVVERTLEVPARVAEDRAGRTREVVALTLVTQARLAPGVARVDLAVRLVNAAADHRLRLLFPTGARTERFVAASTFDAAARTTVRADDAGWIHPAPATFPHQGWVCANGLTVAAPGLPEAEVSPEGVIALTLVRAVGWLSRGDLRTRPVPAGPALPVPGAQCLGSIEAHISLLAGLDPRAARDAELGLWAALAGADPLVPPDALLLRIEPRDVVLSALKPAEAGKGLVLRILNPTDAAHEVTVRCGFDLADASAVRLDETPVDVPVVREGRVVRVRVPGRSLRSIRLLFETRG
jgi:alpha-mannosidase